MLARSTFIATIAVGQTLVMTGGGLDLSVGAMAAFVSGLAILFLNSGLIDNMPLLIVSAMVLSLAVGALVRPVQRPDDDDRQDRAVHRDARHDGHLPLAAHLARAGRVDHHHATTMSGPPIGRSISATCSACPIRCWSFSAWRSIGAFILYGTAYGRHVRAVGSNEDVARYSGINVARVRTITYVLQGLCVALAVIVYVPRLSSASATTGLGWELTAITAVVVGGTRLKGGVGHIWGTIAGALILEVIGNIMLLSNLVSEYLIGAVQGAIIIIAMLAQRGLMRGR